MRLILHLKPWPFRSFWLCLTCVHLRQIQNVKVTHSHSSVKKKHPLPMARQVVREYLEWGKENLKSSAIDMPLVWLWVNYLFQMYHGHWNHLAFLTFHNFQLSCLILFEMKAHLGIAGMSVFHCVFLQHCMWLQIRGEAKEGQAWTTEDTAKAVHESFLWRWLQFQVNYPLKNMLMPHENVTNCCLMPIRWW